MTQNTFYRLVFRSVLSTLVLAGCTITPSVPQDHALSGAQSIPGQPPIIADQTVDTEQIPLELKQPHPDEVSPPEPQKSPDQRPKPKSHQVTGYTVANGDTLWSIAMRPEVYDDPLLWPLIYQANRDQIKDPRQVHSGQVLTIPRNSSEAERDDARQKSRKSDIFPVRQ